MSQGEIIEGKDAPAFFNEHSRKLLRHCGVLTAKAEDDRLVAKGTATFVRVGERHLLFTAKHVIDGLPRDATLLLPLTNTAGAVVGAPAPPEEISCLLEPVWASDAFDVAIVEAPRFDWTKFAWFDLASCVKTTLKVRMLWEPATLENGTLPFALCGYPDYGHLRDEGLRMESLASLPLFGYIDAWSESAVPLTAKTVGQIHIEAVADPRDSAELSALSKSEQMMASRLKDAAVGNPFGGYSGGPFVLFDPGGVHLLGTIKEGGWLFGSKAQFFASPIDDVAMTAGLSHA